MEYIIERYESVKKKTYLSPCLKCNCDNLDVDIYEDKYGDITTITCKRCKNTEKGFKTWNDNNDINMVLTNKTKLFEQLKIEISELKKLKRKRGI